MASSAEQIIAGVVLGERLAVTMYGAIHRAQHAGQRNLRGLIVDAKMLAETGFRHALVDQKGIETALALDHPNIVPAVAVESEGADVVVVTRGTGRYVTAQDLIAAARATRAKKLSPEITALIGRSVVEALAVAHRAGVVHGAVHPRSVLIDEVGDVRLGDFVVGRALTTAVAHGADSSLWRGLAGYISPELVVGEDPTPAADVFAVGALLFTLLTGEIQPGALHVTPAVERLVTRALDTDLARRYKHAPDLLENLLEAFEDDRWELASKAELVKAAGLAAPDSNLDDATEDLLASLGSSAVQVTPMRPSIELRAEQVAARQKVPTGQTTGGRLDALLADLDDTGMTHVDDVPGRNDPVSEIIKLDPRRTEAIVQQGRRVPSLDDPDDDEPAPAAAPTPPAARPPRSRSMDEAAALDALTDLDEPVRRVATAADAAAAAAARLEEAARRAEAAADKVETGPAPRTADATLPDHPIAARANGRAVAPIVDPIQIEAPPVKLRSPLTRIVGGLAVVGIVVGAGYLVLSNWSTQDERAKADKARQDELIAEQQKRHDEAQKKATDALPDAGAIAINTHPQPAGVWLRIGRTPVDTMRLSPGSTHELALVADGYGITQVQVTAKDWSAAQGSAGGERRATTSVKLEPPGKPDPKAKQPPGELPLQPTAVHALQPKELGAGPIHIESTPSEAEAWLYIGNTAGSVRFEQLTAGRAYELLVVMPGYKPKHVSIAPDDWRDNDPNTPIDAAKKKATIERTVELDPVKKGS